MPLSLESRARLNNGVEMPFLGLGVYGIPSKGATTKAVRAALEIGYRHVDTAAMYGNEADVGRAVRESGIPRDEIFVTTKLWNSDHGYEPALKAFDRSLRQLGLDYVDLYLIHWPGSRFRLETWKALETLYARGKARAIGVSNYTIRHLDELLPGAEVVPSVDQVECNPFLPQEELHAYARAQGIQLEAYSPLTKGRRLDDRRLRAVAAAHGKTPAQVLIRWCLEQEIIAIPKSSRQERMKENSDVFDFHLGPDTRRSLGAMDERLHTSWDPTDVP